MRARARRLELAPHHEREEMAEMVVFDLSGRRVAAVSGPAGQTLLWDCRRGDGQLAPNGLYFYRLRVGTFTRQGRVVVIR